jgi:hypothetical protein
VLLVDRRRTFDPSRRLHGHRRAVSLATSFDEHYPMLCDMASRADERMVLDTTDSDRIVRDHVRQDQPTAARCTTHHSHSFTGRSPGLPRRAGSLLIAIRYNLSGNGSHVSSLAALYFSSILTLTLSASRKGNSASHRAFKTAFGISSAGRNTPRDVRTSTISY